MNEQQSEPWRILAATNVPHELAGDWLGSQPDPGAIASETTGADEAWHATQRFLQTGRALLDRIARPGLRTAAEDAAAALIHDRLQKTRTSFLRAHGEHVYKQLTDNYRSFVRVAELVSLAGAHYPGLVPAQAAPHGAQTLRQIQQDGAALEQGIFLAEILRHQRAGWHLIQAMLRPKAESLERLAAFQRDGVADLGAARVERHGAIGYLYHVNGKYLNAEDESTLLALETGVDLILLDPQIQAGVIRGSAVEHPKYRGRRVFNAGLNLTQLYEGRLSFLFFISRELGYMNKLYRGLAGDEIWPPGVEATTEKPWIGAVEAFAVGGGCQLVLILDYVLAEEGSFFVLPALQEGIVPGVANLRVSRFLGARGARRLILFGERINADSAAGSLLCDTVVPPGAMDAAISAAAASLTQSGLVSASSNRKLLRLSEEPLSAFQSYMAEFARDQAACYQSEVLVRNLESSWIRRRAATHTGSI